MIKVKKIVSFAIFLAMTASVFVGSAPTVVQATDDNSDSLVQSISTTGSAATVLIDESENDNDDEAEGDTSSVDPIIKYNFDETSGNTITNSGSAGSTYDAKTSVEINSTKGVTGNALVFDGSSQYVNIPDELSFGEDLTISFWAYSTKSTGAMMYCFGDSNDTTNVMWVNQKSVWNQHLTAGMEPVTNNLVSDSNELSTNEWVYVTVTYTDKTATLYKNGVVVATETLANQPSDYNGSYIDNYIGKSLWPDPYFNGYIDDFRIYNSVLSSDEIAEMAAVADSDFVAKAAENLTLGDTTAVISDLTLPNSGTYGTTIEWSTSDNSVITNTGIVTFADNDKTAVLTATITKGKKSTTKSFGVKVLGKGTAADEFLKKEMDSIVIPNENDIRGNITLSKQTEGGLDITWTSSKPDVISTTETENTDYDSTPAGVVTRQNTDATVTLTPSLAHNGRTLTKNIEVTVKAKVNPIAESDLKGYFYTYFRSNLYNEGESQNIHLATSKDGLFWDDMNNNDPILNATLGTKGVRDSYIVRSPEGDKFYIIGTDLDSNDGLWGQYYSNGSKSIYVWESEDLVNWSEPRLIPIAPDNAGCMWAPETLYDSNTGEYILYFSSNILDNDGKSLGSRILYVKTRDFWTFTDPKTYKDVDGTTTFIDTNTLTYKGTTYRFTKRENDVTVFLEKSDKPLGEFKLVKDKINGEYGVEGPGSFKINGEDKFMLYLDGYCLDNPNVGFFPLIAESPEDLNSGNFRRLDSTEFRMPTGAKHGCMLPITQDEYNRVMDKWGKSFVTPVTPDTSETISPDLEYKFDETLSGPTAENTGVSGTKNNGTLYNGATYITDSEKGKVLSLTGGAKNTNSPYMELPDDYFIGKDNVSIFMDIKSQMDNQYFMTFAVGKDTQKYMYLRTRANEIYSALTVKSSAGEQNVKITPDVANKNNWIKVGIVLSRNDDGNHSTMSIYKDGVLVGQNVVLTENLSTMGDTLKAYIGKSLYSDPYFNGYIDNVQVYNRALTGDQISKLGITTESSSIDEAISAANTAIDAVKVSTDGNDVLETDKWVTQLDVDTLKAAIEIAKSATDEDEDAAATLNSAVAIFNEAAKVGLKTVTEPTKPIDKSTIPVEVRIEGTEIVSNTLEAKLLGENGVECTTSSAITYEWYRLSSEDSEDGELIGADKTYKLVSSDEGNYIKLVVTCEDKTFDDITSMISKKSSSSSSTTSETDDTTANNTANNTNTSEDSNSSNNGSITIIDGWKNNNDNTWIYTENGQPVSGWKQIDGTWYLMDSTGVMQTGWKQINGTWYLLKDNGAMATGWVQTNSKWYYLYSDGAMASNTIIDGYTVDESGDWVE